MPVFIRLGRALKPLLDAVLYSSTWLALAALGLTWTTFLLWRVPLPPRLGGLIFAATLFLYNLDSVLPYKQRQWPGISQRKQWIRRHRAGLVGLASGAMLVAGSLFLADAHLHLTLFLAHLAAISVLYSTPLVRRHGRWRALRDLPLLKVFLIAYVWAAVTVWIPALYLHRPLLAPEVLVLFARRFLFILALAFVFDIRDYTKDRLMSTRTFPGVLGIRATKLVGIGALVVAALLVPPGLSEPQALSLLVPLVVAAAVIWYAKESRPDYYFAFLTDGVMLVQFVVVWCTRT